MKLRILLLILLLLSVFFVISENKLALKNPDNFKELSTTYNSWAKKAISNSGEITKQVTGHVIKMDWSVEE